MPTEPSFDFSPSGRRDALEAMATSPVDVLVIGGGITGAGIARDAALRGWSTALVEKEDFGFGTSSRSSKKSDPERKPDKARFRNPVEQACKTIFRSWNHVGNMLRRVLT